MLLNEFNLRQINNHLQNDLIEQKGVDFQVILIPFFVLVNRKIGYDLYRLVYVLKLLG